ncbi:FTR1 family protein [Helicovermis profundi]|uniref:FTR1 family protein n=1 Tax=Helicovermis profundi TaxID=3065157 RepID=A0AAU9E1X3_9FIRM|nr:FTR1 family protein [Clostridia bacterium S502]
MNIFLPGLIMGFREGLEAFLVVAVILQLLGKIEKKELKINAIYGAIIGIIGSIVFGGTLYFVTNSIDKTSEFSKLWESLSSFIALGFIVVFIYWMIKNGSQFAKHAENKILSNLSSFGVFAVVFMMVMREGLEISLFTFAGKYDLFSIILGVSISLIFTVLIFYSLIKINIKTLFSITLLYLILQAGFLLGYSVHEGLSALKSFGLLNNDNILFTKLFNLSNTALNHKTGIIGLPLYVLFGWYSKPEVIQFILQYSFTAYMLSLWKKTNSQNKVLLKKAS